MAFFGVYCGLEYEPVIQPNFHDNHYFLIARCVPDNKRAFSYGFKYVVVKILGLLPGPIIFGHVVDSYCTVWQDTCGVKGRCFDYDIEKLSYAICVYGTVFTCKFWLWMLGICTIMSTHG